MPCSAARPASSSSTAWPCSASRSCASASSIGRRLATGKVSLGIEYDLRNRLWAQLLRQPASYFDRWPTGQLMSRAMSDVQNVRMFLGYGLVFFTTNVVMMVAVVILLFVLDWQLALISLAFLPACSS